MAKRMRKTLVLAKVQITAGTDAVPEAATNAMLCRATNITPVSAEFAARNLMRPYLGNGGSVAVTQYSQIELEIELAGSGTAGTAPAFGPLLRACGLAETITASVDAAYEPVSDGFELITVYAYLDGILHKMVDCRATMRIDISSRAIPFLAFTIMGRYEPLTDALTPTGVDFAAFQKPLGVNKANTPAWSLGAYTGCLQSFQMDLANQLEWRSLIGCEGAEVSDRAPTGTAVLELPSIANLNWPSLVVSGTLSAFSITHGTVAGNIAKIDLPKVQLINPTYSDQNGIAMLNMNLEIQPDAGNDELVMTFS